MGSSFHVHVGPYLKIKKSYQKVNMARWGCVIEGCSYRHKNLPAKNKFCAGCGSRLTEFSETVTQKAFWVHDILGEEYEDSLAHFDDIGDINFEYWFPNQRGSRRFTLDQHDANSEIHGDQIDKDNEIHWMLDKYDEELKLLNAQIGSENIQVCWGIVSYFN